MSITLTIVAESLSGALDRIIDSPEAVSLAVAKLSDSALLEAVRARFRKQGMVINPAPFAAAEETTADPGPTTPVDPVDPATKTPASRRKKEGNKDAAPAPIQGNATVAAPGLAGPTTPPTQPETPTADPRAQVIAALDAYSTKHGQAAARVKMQEVGGNASLAAIPADKYPALVLALAV